MLLIHYFSSQFLCILKTKSNITTKCNIMLFVQVNIILSVKKTVLY